MFLLEKRLPVSKRTPIKIDVKFYFYIRKDADDFEEYVLPRINDVECLMHNKLYFAMVVGSTMTVNFNNIGQDNLVECVEAIVRDNTTNLAKTSRITTKRRN